MIRPILLLLAIAYLPLAFEGTIRANDVVRVRNREEFSQALREAQAGRTILLAAGAYRGGLSRRGPQGTEQRPIVIAGEDPARPPVIEGGGSGLHLSSPENVVLRDLVFAGAAANGLNLDDGGSPTTPARGIVLQNLAVRDVGPVGNRDGIKLSGVQDFRVENCRIQRWGSSGSGIDMVGCRGGLVQGCTFAEASGDSANGVQTKGGSRDIVIRRCRFEHPGGRGVNVGGSTGLAYFRPEPQGFEAKNITVEDCVFLGGLSAVALVGVDGALIQHNTIFRPRRWAIRILQENIDPQFVACRQGRFLRNVIAFRADECREVVNIGGQTAPETFEFAGNVWCCLDRPEETRRRVRLPVRETQGRYEAPPAFHDVESGDFRIRDRGPDDAGVRQPRERRS